MKTKVLAMALATVASTFAADAAFARDSVRISESGQLSVQRGRKTIHRYQLPSALVVDSVVAAGTAYGWAVPYVGSIGGYGYSTDW